MNTIKIAMTTDKNYITPTKVAISSMLTHSNISSFFEINILCAKSLDEVSRDRLRDLEHRSQRLKIIFHEIEDKRLSNAATTAHIPIASYYRLYICQLIEGDRCLFVDGDMIIKDDLLEVYNINLEGYYIAGVKDMGIQSHFEEYKEYAQYLQIPSMDKYVNAGFMLFNLKEIRKDNLQDKLIDEIARGYKYMDQDILNKLCYNKIKNISLRYDFFTEYAGSLSKLDLSGYDEKNIHDIENDICVLHYTGTFKPWLCKRLTVNQIWWDEAKIALTEDEYAMEIRLSEEFERKSDWQYILDNTKKEKEVVIFGFSKIGKKIAEKLIQSGVDKIVAFCDNDDSKRGLEHRSIPVLMTKEIKKKYPDAKILISSQNGYIQIEKQLVDLGYSENKIVRYINKDDTYYARLDKSYREMENDSRIMSDI